MSAASPTLTRAISAKAELPAWILRPFAIDSQALVILRIGLGALLLWDLAFRARDLTAHYTDDGVLPRAGRIAMQWEFCEPWWMSLHMLSGSWWWQATLFAIAAIAAGMLVVGYRTKPALFVSWLLLLSLHGRFPLLTQGGDMLLRCMLVWSMFLPLDSKKHYESGYLVSFGTAGFVMQLAVMYLFTALLKTSPTWRGEFSAAYYALSIDHFTSELGYVMLAHPRLLQLLTASAILLEWAGPLLLLAPIGHRWIRTIIPLSFISFHLGLAATMDLGTFPWICMLFWVVLLPPEVWNLLPQLNFTFALKPRTTDVLTFVGSPFKNCLAACLICYVVVLNFQRLSHPLATVGQPPLSLVGKVTGLEQYWNMFSPGPYKFGSWLRLEGTTAEGQLVNLLHPDQPLPDAKPANVSNTYPTQYWRRCLVTLYEFEERPHLEGTLRYFARQWNASHSSDERIVKATLVHMVEPTPEPFAAETARSVERRELCTIKFD